MTRFRDDLLPGARTFETRLQVQWADVDIAGIMYFAAYWRFAEYAEMGLFEAIGFPYDRVFDELDFWLPRVKTEAEYHAPAAMNDWIRLRTHVEKVGASSVKWTTVLFNERTGAAMAVMRLTVACMNRATKHSMPLPPALREALLQAMLV
jgi:YbgC/YbaW family acyl-CoA thioester hydrolase